jgi:hypothetical protein
MPYGDSSLEGYTRFFNSRIRTVIAYDRVVMIKTLRCPVKAVWVYHKKTQWVALFSHERTAMHGRIILF